jgi:glycerophosphoryl diester phosphodiesterase
VTKPRPARRRRRRTVLLGANVLAIGAFLLAGGWDVVQVSTGLGLGERAGAPMAIVAHRGDLDRWPENTAEGIVAAAELPIDGIEFDTIVSADGTWWLIHDPDPSRTTSLTGWFPELPDEAIRAAEIIGGVGFNPDRHHGLRIPTLADVLDSLRGFEGTLYVDVQHSPTGDVSDVVRLLGDRPAAILCRNLDDARTVKELNPDIETYLRPAHGPADASVDGWLMESFFEADAGAVEGSDLPVITFVDQWRAGESEDRLIRRAWAIGVRAFLTKAPAEALATRAELMNGR